jgi:hypothetical protein
MSYEPKYIDLSMIPVQVPDDYSTQEKRDAVEFAESMLELDVNDAAKIMSQDLTPYHIAAVKQLATSELTKGAEDNDDVALQDLDDTGSTKSEYSRDAFKERYEMIVTGIQKAVNSQSTGVYVRNTESSHNWKDWDRYFNDPDFDLDIEEDYDV